MKFEFVKGNEVNTRKWSKMNAKLHADLAELVGGKLPYAEVQSYLQEMCDALEALGHEAAKGMLFLMYDEPRSMPSDARVEFVYTPTYLAAAIMMSAYCRYAQVRQDKALTSAMAQVLYAATGRRFLGSGFCGVEGLLDSLELFAEGDTYSFVERYPEISTEFTTRLAAALTYLETEICEGKIIDGWSGKDEYSTRGKEVLKKITAQNPNCSKYVWYACYGSNLSLNRFMKYIQNCDDKTPPVADRPYSFRHSIYFAKHSANWNGAKAFLDVENDGFAYGRIYKVTRAQYQQIKQQEGADYQKLVECGFIEGLPVYSFTDAQRSTETKTPSRRYYETILSGLDETYHGLVPKTELIAYLDNTIMPHPAAAVAKAVQRNAHYLTARLAMERTGLDAAQTLEAVKWLVEHRVLRQDRRSVQAGHDTSNLDAYYFTADSESARALVKAMDTAASENLLQ